MSVPLFNLKTHTNYVYYYALKRLYWKALYI